MTVVQDTVLTISCDNPACPGTNLDTGDRAGWTFVTTEVYGEATQQHVYCGADCAGTISLKLAADEEQE